MEDIKNKVRAAIDNAIGEKAKQIAVAQAVGRVAERLQNYNDHTGVQYALACAYPKSDIVARWFISINKRHMELTYMSDDLIKEREYWGKDLAKHIKAIAPYGYEELKLYAVMFSID